MIKMSFDAKGIQLFLWRIIKFSGTCCYRFVRKYPVVSGFLTILFFLYIYFASVFYFLMYSSPILVCTVVSIRFYLKTKHPEFQWIKKRDGNEKSSGDVNRSNGPPLRHQKSVRRNARMKLENVEWDRSEEIDILFPRSPYAVLEGNSKFIFDVKSSPCVEHGDFSSHNKTGNDQVVDDRDVVFDNETSKSHCISSDKVRGQSEKVSDDGALGADSGGGGGEEEVQSLEEGEDEEDEEVQESGNKAVEWTEDDEKNLMDLGLLELERNRRLESLIAKRKAKKLLNMAVQKNLMDMNPNVLPSGQIAPIIIVKNNLLGFSSNLKEDELQVPGSAPSILLPTQNPFDLPYDPLEEKPNLMADSFQQEFMAAHHKDMLFCRHESFFRGPIFTLETTEDLNKIPCNPYQPTNIKLVEGPELPRLKKQPGEDHHRHNSFGMESDIDLVELQEANHNEAVNSLEGNNEKDRIEIKEEKMEKVHDNEPGLDNGSEIKMETNSIKNNDSCSSSLSEGSDSVLDQTSKCLGMSNDQGKQAIRMETNSIKNNDSCYSSSSEASDSLDQRRKCLGMSNDQGKKALNLLIPPKGRTVIRSFSYDSSPSPCERPRTDFSIFYNTYRRHNHTPSCSIASDLQVEVSEIGSPPLTNDGTLSSVDGDSVTYDGDVERDINSDGEDLWGDSFNLSRGEANREKLKELQDIIEEDSVELELPGLNRKPGKTIASAFPSEQEAKAGLNRKSIRSSRLHIAKNGASHPKNIKNEINEDVKKVDGVDGSDTIYISDISPENPGKTMHLMEKLVIHSPSGSCSQKPEQLLVEPQQKPTEELSIVGHVEPITQKVASPLDLKSSENKEMGANILNEPAVLGDMREPTEATNLDSSKQTHGNLGTSYDSKITMESEKEVEESQLSKYIEEVIHNLTEDAPNTADTRDQPIKDTKEDTQNLTEHDTGDAPSEIQSIDDMEPDNIIDQNVAEDNDFGVKQRLGGPIATALNQRLAVEQISTGSYSSPRSVLPQNILEDHIPISYVEQRIQRDLPQSIMEGTPRDNLTDDQPQENSTFNMPLYAQQLVENSVAHSSSNHSFGKLEGSSNMTENSTNSTIQNMNKAVLEDTHGKEVSSIKTDVDESQALMSSCYDEELSVPSRNSNASYIEHLEQGSEELAEYHTGIDQSKLEEDSKSDTPETMDKKEEPTYSPRKVLVVVEDIKNSLANEKEAEEKLTEHEGESQFSIRLEDMKGPKESNGNEADVNKTEANESKIKSAAEVDHIGNADSLADEVTDTETLIHVLGSEGEPQIIGRQQVFVDPTKTFVATIAETVENDEHESQTQRLIEAEAEDGPSSTLAGESNGLNDIKNGEDIIQNTRQEDVLDLPQVMEDNLTTDVSIDNKIATEISKPTKSEIQAVNTEDNDSSAVAK